MKTSVVAWNLRFTNCTWKCQMSSGLWRCVVMWRDTLRTLLPGAWEWTQVENRRIRRGTAHRQVTWSLDYDLNELFLEQRAWCLWLYTGFCSPRWDFQRFLKSTLEKIPRLNLFLESSFLCFHLSEAARYFKMHGATHVMNELRQVSATAHWSGRFIWYQLEVRRNEMQDVLEHAYGRLTRHEIYLTWFNGNRNSKFCLGFH